MMFAFSIQTHNFICLLCLMQVIDFKSFPIFVAAAVINWSSISLVDLIAFLLLQYNAPKIGKLLYVV